MYECEGWGLLVGVLKVSEVKMDEEMDEEMGEGGWMRVKRGEEKWVRVYIKNVSVECMRVKVMKGLPENWSGFSRTRSANHTVRPASRRAFHNTRTFHTTRNTHLTHHSLYTLPHLTLSLFTLFLHFPSFLPFTFYFTLSPLAPYL
jgi:hypothetical protein